MKVQKGAEMEHDSEENGMVWDDVPGEFLDLKEVRRARLKEIEFIEKKNVWKKIKRKDAERLWYKILKTRWIGGIIV